LKGARIDGIIVAQGDAFWKWSRKGDLGFVDEVVMFGRGKEVARGGVYAPPSETLATGWIAARVKRPRFQNIPIIIYDSNCDDQMSLDFLFI